MNKNTTSKQWNKLTKKQQLIIAKRFGDDIEDFDFSVKNPGIYISLSIGDMIEFLMEDNLDSFSLNFIHKPIPYWSVTTNVGGAMSEDIVEALWEAIKQLTGNRIDFPNGSKIVFGECKTITESGYRGIKKAMNIYKEETK